MISEGCFWHRKVGADRTRGRSNGECDAIGIWPEDAQRKVAGPLGGGSLIHAGEPGGVGLAGMPDRCSDRSHYGFGATGTTVTGTGECLSTFSATLPKRKLPFSPWLAMTTISTFSFSISLRISLAASPTATCLM